MFRERLLDEFVCAIKIGGLASDLALKVGPTVAGVRGGPDMVKASIAILIATTTSALAASANAGNWEGRPEGLCPGEQSKCSAGTQMEQRLRTG